MCWSLDQWRRRIGLGGHVGCTSGTIRSGRSNAERSADENEREENAKEEIREEVREEIKQQAAEAVRRIEKAQQQRKERQTDVVNTRTSKNESSFNPPVSTTTETTSSDEHVVDLVEGVAETISTSSSDPVAEVESSSMHLVEDDLLDTREGSDMSVGSSVLFDQLTDDLFLEIDDDGADLVVEPSSQLFDSDDESSSGKYEYALF